MLEGLDQIDWTKLGTLVYGKPASEVPTLIRILTSDDEISRQIALDHLFGVQQDGGTITTATPYIIPFVLELLKYEITPEKDMLFACIFAVADKLSFARCDFRNAQTAILLTRTYEAIAAGIPIYLSSMADDDHSLRYVLVCLLGNLTGNPEAIVPVLVECFLREEDKTVASAILISIGQLIFAWNESDTYAPERYVSFLEDVTSNEALDIDLRRVATHALIEALILKSPERPFSPAIIEILTNEYLDMLARPLGSFNRENVIWLLGLADYKALVPLINHPSTEARDAHFIALSMLERSVGRYPMKLLDWKFYRGRDWGVVQQTIATGNYYGFVPTMRQLLTNDQAEVVSSIVKGDKFWEIPTNLFSFFYGLPDSREELRKLIEQAES